MTNPNNAVGTNGAYSGRTSVYAFNDDLAAYSRGILSGWGCSPNSGMTVSLGGNGTTRDVGIAEDNIGNKTTINNISLSPINVTISAAPSTNSRIDSIVAYVNNAPIGVSTVSDNPAACGLIVVKGTAAANPTAPNNTTIRSAITSDGGSGVTAYYVVLANITVPSGTTTLTSSNISAGNSATIGPQNLDFASSGLGETIEAPLVVNLPNTASNGANVIMSTGSKSFSGGTYILEMPSVCVSLSTNNYQALIVYRIDGGAWNNFLDWAYWGNNTLVGSVSASIPIHIDAGNHTIDIGFGTNSSSKVITVDENQQIKAYLVKVGP